MNKSSDKCPICKQPSSVGMCQNCKALLSDGMALLKDPNYVLYQDGKVEAAKWLDAWADQLAVVFASGRPPLPKHQIRAVYGPVKRIEAARFRAVPDELRKVKPWAHRQFERGKIPEEFKIFLSRNIDHATTADQFARFAKHFEAVLAYCEGRLKETQ